MAEIIGNEGGGGGKHQKKRAKKGRVHIDMTPMVDLAFLLLTFFILATTLSKPKTMEIVYPKEKDVEKDKQTQVAEELATIVLLGLNEDEIGYYFGKFRPDTTEVTLSDLSKEGLRKIFFKRNKDIIMRLNEERVKLNSRQMADSTFNRIKKEIKGDSLAPFVVVKTLDSTAYRMVIDVIDDLNIADVGKYAIQDMAETERIALKQAIAAKRNRQ